VSVGHVARALEEAGIPTVVVMVKAFRHVAERMSLPRTVVTPHPMGRPFGPIGDVATQTRVVDAALDLLDAATANGVVVELTEPFRPGSSRPTSLPEGGEVGGDGADARP
jgi:hypothetical protein